MSVSAAGPQSSDAALSVEIEGRIGRIVLGTAGRAHVVDEPFGRRLADASRQLGSSTQVRAVILSSNASVFCAGVDFNLAEKLRDPEYADALLSSLNDGIAALADLAKPVVAAVDGAAYGGGHNLALACDVIVASSRARFCQAFGNIGLATDVGSLYLLPQRVSHHRAKELAMTGRALSAEEAAELGLVDEVVSSADLEARAVELAERLADRPPLAMAAMKRGFAAAWGPTFRQTLDLEKQLQMTQFASDDLQEGVAAFRERRAPRFEGR